MDRRNAFYGGGGPMDQAGLAKIGSAAIALAEAEGLPAHAKSVELRLK